MEIAALSVLVIEDDDLLRKSICSMLEKWTMKVWEARSKEEAIAKLALHPDVLVLDVGLPDGSGLEVAAEASQLDPSPLCIAISGNASAEDAFMLSKYGVDKYLQKPFSSAELAQTIDSILSLRPDIAPHLKTLVGREGFKTVQAEVRRTMVVQALARSQGNVTKAASLLSVTRQAVQHMVRELDLDPESFRKKPDNG